MTTAIERVNTSWQTLLDTIDTVPGERMHEHGASGKWSVKDILSHIAVWDDIQVDKIALKKNGAPLPEWDGFQAINDREHAARSGWTIDQSHQEMLAAHDRMLAALDTVPGINPEEVKDDTWGHYDEHAESIRSWLDA